MEGLEDTSVDDTSVDENADEPIGESEETPAAGATSKDAPPAKLKLAWLGREEEIDDPRVLAERFSDKYEYEFKGPQGKPVKKNWHDIQRAVQLAEGAQDAIRQAAEERKRIGSDREWGKKNTLDYVQRFLGVEDPEAWAMELAGRAYQEEAKLAQLMQEDPMAGARFARELEQRKLTRVESWKKQEAAAQEERAQYERTNREMSAAMNQALEKAGVKPSGVNLSRAVEIYKEHRELGIRLDMPTLANMVHKEKRAELMELLNNAGDELPRLLGDDLRRRLREFELKSTKDAKRTEREKAGKDAQKRIPTTNTPRKPGKPITIDDLKIKGGW